MNQETLARARELLILQGYPPSALTKVITEEETQRYLIANKFDIEKTSQAISNRVKFKLYFINNQNNNVFSCIDFQTIEKLFPLNWGKGSNTLFASFSSTFDVHKFITACGNNLDGVKLFFEWFGEKLLSICNKTTLTLFIDLSTATLGQTTTSEFDSCVRIGLRYLLLMLPEKLNRIYFLNSPPTFNSMIFLFKRLLPENTFRKFIVIDSLVEIEKIFSLMDIPQKMGGKLVLKGESSFYLNQNQLVDESEMTLINDDSKKKQLQAVNMIEKNDEDSIKQMLDLLEISISKANECESRHLEENNRIRKKIQQMINSKQKNGKMVDSKEEEDARNRLFACMEERDAYARAVNFARNFIEQEENERKEFEKEMERQISLKKQENIALVEELKNRFGEGAPNLFLS